MAGEFRERYHNPPVNLSFIQELEATLHCIASVQEAVSLEDNAQLRRLFSQDILDRLPTTGSHRVRRTMLIVIGTYASWFTTQSRTGDTFLLMSAVSHVVQALREPGLCFHAANALRDLCDANRTALAPHISAFSDLHSGLAEIPVSIITHVDGDGLYSNSSTGRREVQSVAVHLECHTSTTTSRANSTSTGYRNSCYSKTRSGARAFIASTCYVSTCRLKEIADRN